MRILKQGGLKGGMLLLLGVGPLAGCSQVPAYTPLKSEVSASQFSNLGPWAPAGTAQNLSPTQWWRVFEDETLNQYEAQLNAQSLQLASLVARYDQAVLLTHQAKAQQLPSVFANASASRSKDPRTAELTSLGVGASFSYELDLWGRIRANVANAAANQQAQEADLVAARLGLQAKLAETYVALRGADAQLELLQQTEGAYQKALHLTKARFSAGAAAEIDLNRAQNQLATTRASLEQLRSSRSLYAHALAVLMGQSPIGFEVASLSPPIKVPVVPVSTPAELLQRRPDIAALERRVFAANSRIGVAKAAFFPTVSLSANGGHQDYETVSGAYWALGPASVSLPVFDGGQRQSGLGLARLDFEQAALAYKQGVLVAFQDVEDQLVLANRLALAHGHQKDAVVAAERANQLSLVQYKEGAASYLEVVSAQTAELEAKRSALTLQTSRLLAAIDLIRALGGGWDGTLSSPSPKKS